MPKDGKVRWNVSPEGMVVISAGSDIVSSYDWRGVKVTGAAFQPSLSLEVAGFSATAWGSVDFAGTYREMDLTLAYYVGPVSVCVTDYYWTGHAKRSASFLNFVVRRILHHAAHAACRHCRSRILLRNVSDCALCGEEHSGN